MRTYGGVMMFKTVLLEEIKNKSLVEVREYLEKRKRIEDEALVLIKNEKFQKAIEILEQLN